jgi:hypothetical protein
MNLTTNHQRTVQMRMMKVMDVDTGMGGLAYTILILIL